MTQTATRTVPVACDSCGEDLQLTTITEGDEREVLVDCPACGRQEVRESQHLETVSALVDGPGFHGPRILGRFWTTTRE